MKIHRLSVKKAQSIKDSLIGLIGAKKNSALFLVTRFGIHTYGVRFPIDVLILDNNYRIVRIRQSLLPYRLFFWPPRYNYVLELPQGTIAIKQMALGDKILLTLS